MPALLDLSRNKGELTRQLLRRIGYTQGLFSIFRFEDLIDLVGESMPMPVAAVDLAIQRHFDTKKSYAQGIRDVSISLGLFVRAGSRLALAPGGRALLGLRRLYGPKSTASRLALLTRVIDADGEYTMTLLLMDSSGPAEEQGESLFAITGALIDLKREWLAASPASAPTRRLVIRYLDSAAETLLVGRRAGVGRLRSRDGISTATFRHTVAPRSGWIEDLGLATPPVRSGLIGALAAAGQYCKGFVALGLAGPLRDRLRLEGFPLFDRNQLWSVVTAAQTASEPPLKQPPDLNGVLRASYPHIRLRSFNQVEVAAVYELAAATWAATGHLLDVPTFSAQIDNLIATEPGTVWRLSARRGGDLAGYLALRS